jgi:hypothetical protein
MATITFSAAARMMGWKSRSTLYRLRDGGRLDGYIRTADDGGTVLELEPEDLPPLEQHLRNEVRVQANSPSMGGQQRPQVPDPVSQAQQQLARVAWQMEAVQEREANWIEAYSEFRQWLSEDYVMELLHGLPDPAPIGQVMVRCRETILARLAMLDRCESNSRWPR